MLNENIKAIRKSKGLSQQELAIKLNVVRQTISKWEQGLSVPDSDMLISISEVLETPVSTLTSYISIVAIGIPKDRKVSRLYFTPTFSFSGSHAAVIR